MGRGPLGHRPWSGPRAAGPRAAGPRAVNWAAGHGPRAVGRRAAGLLLAKPRDTINLLTFLQIISKLSSALAFEYRLAFLEV